MDQELRDALARIEGKVDGNHREVVKRLDALDEKVDGIAAGVRALNANKAEKVA